ncbi:hypothetical protein OAS39_05900 [Pirellulales bacterium]|nr:hypothetical protein [Pirellulales bacterium]
MRCYAEPYLVCTDWKWYDNGTYCIYDATRRNCWPSLDPSCCSTTGTFVRHWDYNDHCPSVPNSGPCPLVCEEGECLEMGNPSSKAHSAPCLSECVDKNYEPSKDELGDKVKAKKRRKFVSFVPPSGQGMKYAAIFFLKEQGGGRKACVGFEIANPEEATDHVTHTTCLDGHRFVCELRIDGKTCTVITTAD